MAFQGFPFPKQSQPQSGSSEGLSRPFTRPLVARNESNISLTLDIPAEAAKLLTQLAEKNSYAFRQLGILTMQLQGEKPLTTSQVPTNCDESEDSKISKSDSTKAGLLKRPASSPLRPGFISPAAGCDSPERKRRKHEIPAPPGLQAGPFSSSVPSLSLTNGFVPSPSEGFSGNSLFSRLGSSPPDLKVKSRINLLARMNRMKPSETITRPNDLIAAALAKSTDVPKKKFSPSKSITEPGYVAEDSSSEGEPEFELRNKSIKIPNEIMKRGYNKTVNNRRSRDEDVDSATKIKLMLSSTSSSINRSPQSAKVSPSGAESHTDTNHHGGDAKVKLVLSMREKKVKKISTGGKGTSDLESDDDEEFDSIKLKSIMKAKHTRSLGDRIPALPTGTNPCDKTKHLEFGSDPRPALDGPGSSGGPLSKSLTPESRLGFWSRPNDGVNCNDEINLRLSDSLNRHSMSAATTKCKSPTNPTENDNTSSESQLLVNDRLLGLNNANESDKFLLEDRSDYKAVDGKSENSRNECSEVFNLPHRDTDSNVHQGDDSGIESMDTLSEKSPNQGETPTDDKIDREIKELEANSIIAGNSLKDANHLALLHNEPSNKSNTSDDGLDFHQSAPCITVKGSTPDLVKKSDDSTIQQNNTSSCKITADDFPKEEEENTEHISAASERPTILETDASFVDKSQAQTIESENCTSAILEIEPSSPPKESVTVDSVEKVSISSSCASSPTKSPEELTFEDPSPVPEPEFVDSTQKEIQPSPMQSLLARAVKTQSAPSNTVHVNGSLSSGSLQLRPASMVPTGAKMVPVKVVSVSNDGAVRLLRVSPMKSTASNDPTVIPSRAVVIKSSMLRNAVSQQKDLAANPSLLQAQLAASKPISPSLLTNIKDTVKPPSLFNIINSTTNPKSPSTSLVTQPSSIIAKETNKTAELYSFPQDLKEKVVHLPVTPVSQSSSIIASVQMNSSSLSITPVVSQPNSLSSQETMETAIKAVKSKPRLDSSPLLTKADLPVGLRLPESTTLTKVEDKPKDESKIKGRSRPQKRTSSNNADYGGSMLRPLLQKDETAEEVLTRSNARLKPGEQGLSIGEEPTKTTDLIETQHESQTAEKKEPESEHLVQNAESKLRFFKEEDKGLNSTPDTQGDKVEAKLTPTRKTSRSETNVEKQAPKIKASPTDAPSSASQVEDVKERRSVRQQNPAFVAKMQANRITKATVSRQKVNSDQAQENIDTDWVAKPRRATASQAAGGSLNDKGSSSALNNSCSVVVEANKNMAGAKRIKTRSNKAADDQVETKRRRLKVESL